jgi:Lar family restriction alleviation protein
MTDLKPCPFCGGEAYQKTAFPHDEDGLEMNLYIVGCKICDIEFSWLWDKEVAIRLWNTRNGEE